MQQVIGLQLNYSSILQLEKCVATV